MNKKIDWFKKQAQNRFLGPNSRDGQTSVIILLVMTALFTVAMSLAVQTTQKAFLAGKKIRSQEVLAAAESVAEEYANIDLSIFPNNYENTTTTSDGIEVTVSIRQNNTLEMFLYEGISVDVNVQGATTGSELVVRWLEPDSCTSSSAALFYTAYNADPVSGEITARHEGIAACSTPEGSWRGSNNLDTQPYDRIANIPTQTGDVLIRIRPVFNDAPVAVHSQGFSLPVQYYTITSEARDPQTRETSTVEVTKSVAAAPSIFDYAAISGISFDKN